MNTLPLFFYPLTVALIDDDSLVLQSMTCLLKRHHPLKTFDSPKEATEFFENYKPTLSDLKFLRGCSELENYDVSGHLPVDLNLQACKALSENLLRSSEIGVIIIDYNMPGMNGLEVCRKLKSFPLKKILLTGETNNQLAIDAFNEGVIDCFIRKDSLTLAEEINSNLRILINRYFADNTKQLKNHLEIEHALPISDPEFIRFFQAWCQQNDIKEYYIIDQNADFLLVDKNNQKSFFVIHTERTLKHFIDIHKDDEEVGSLIDLIAQRKRIPFFNNGNESWNVRFSEWDSYLLTPQVLTGREKYYWAVTKTL